MSYQGKDDQVVPTNQNEKGKIDVTSTIMLRTILDKASSTKDAIKILQNINLHYIIVLSLLFHLFQS